MITTINCKGRILDLSHPVIMGILNTTPDSFFDGGQYTSVEAALLQAEKLIAEGATIIDIGGASSRPGAAVVTLEEELHRVIPVVRAIHQRWPEQIISVDTWRAMVAEQAVETGASIINDISAGTLDPEMFPAVARCKVPYILMHIQGNPQNMQQSPHYEDIVLEVLDYFIQKIHELHQIGVHDIIIDPGFGFGKTLEHNYTLFKGMHQIARVTERPLLVGISRKSMLSKLLHTTADQTLNATTALNMLALEQGAKILRVHDVAPAMEVLNIWHKASLLNP